MKEDSNSMEGNVVSETGNVRACGVRDRWSLMDCNGPIPLPTVPLIANSTPEVPAAESLGIPARWPPPSSFSVFLAVKPRQTAATGGALLEEPT
ncbi:hypothetical protein NDU88_002103 [Pleurodeles waltl]|uniref:Uncharacterized protein n=1 Tax=Pleurodeles waltl TaxID=8319 RepID=A0AAV7UAA2_PLEWA|nr:hypothetical protein NDU88_002103 [Pleurodeles waltl]